MWYNIHMDATQITIALIAAIPTTATALSTVYLNSKRLKDREEAIQRDENQRKLAVRNAAKASIENMITQDIIRTEILGQMPENRDNIEAEYTDYHNNGGNGRVTREVEEYKAWYRGFRPEKLDKKKIVA